MGTAKRQRRVWTRVLPDMVRARASLRQALHLRRLSKWGRHWLGAEGDCKSGLGSLTRASLISMMLMWTLLLQGINRYALSWVHANQQVS
jgi:hypothetical protein